MLQATPVLALRGINKAFAAPVLEDIDFACFPGQVTALLGENGAGKSTLMKIANGIIQPDSGSILLDGQTVQLRSPNEAVRAGIAMIHQELNLAPNRTTWQNIFLGREIRASRGFRIPGYLDEKAMREQARKELERIDAGSIPLDVAAGTLPTAQQQLIEIAKAISINSRVLFMDEPTSSLTEDQSASLIRLIKNLRDTGLSIVFTTHRVKEAFEIADRFVILRDGMLVEDAANDGGVDYDAIIASMVGRSVKQLYPRRKEEPGAVLLEAKGITTSFLKNVSFSLRKGEILGFGGLVGAGRTELMRAIFGADPLAAGKLFLRGEETRVTCPHDMIGRGIGLLPEDRKTQSIIPDRSVRYNISIASLPLYFRSGVIRNAKTVAFAKEYIERFKIRLHSSEQSIRSLSGGNQQKAVLAKWLLLNPSVLILDEPTRGIDVGAREDIYRLVVELADKGISIILISSDLPELVGLSDRVVVMAEGEIMRILEKDEISPERIMHHAGLKQ